MYSYLLSRNTGHHIINRCERAMTSKKALKYLDDYIFVFDPDILIIHLGIVDCWIRENGLPFVNKQEFFKNIRTIYQKIKYCTFYEKN